MICKKRFWIVALMISGSFVCASKGFAYVNVQDYGAIGNGISDDTASIQAALNTGDAVYFPKTSSYYKVSSVLNYMGPKVLSNGATIKSINPDFNILRVYDYIGVYIGDLNIEYAMEQTTLEQSNQPLLVDDCTDIIIERVNVKNGGSIYLYSCTGGVIRDCRALASAYNAFYIHLSDNILVENCYAEKNNSGLSTEQSFNIKLINNTIEDSYGGIRIEDSDTIVAQGNLLKYCQSGIVVYGAESGYDFPTSNITVKGNTLYHCYKTISIDKDEEYVNHACEFAMATKMYVENVLFENNIVIGNDESTLLTNLSSNVVFNTSLPFSTRQVLTDSSGTSYYTMVPYTKYVSLTKNDGQMPMGWLFYVNFPTALNLSQEMVLTIDTYWGGNTMWYNDVLAVKLYSGENRTGYICEIPLYMPYKEIALPAILWVPDGADVSSVKCIEVVKKTTEAASVICFSDFRKGLKSKVGYLHSYLGSEVFDTTLSSNVFLGHTFDYVNRKRYPSEAPTIITGSGITGTTAQRPVSPELGWRYYDTTLSSPICWDGSDWLDINTYWMSEKTNEAIHFEGTNYVELNGDPRMNVNSYTVEGWVKPTTGGTVNFEDFAMLASYGIGTLSGPGDFNHDGQVDWLDWQILASNWLENCDAPDWCDGTDISPNSTERHIIGRCDIGAPYGFLMSLYTDNHLWAYQSVGGNFYAVAKHASFPHDNEFHHVAMTFSYNGSSSVLSLYIDGVLASSGSAAGAPDFPPSGTKIKFGNSSSGMVGSIDGFNYYTRVLNGTEIAMRYNKGRDHLRAYWRFNEGSGSTTKDSSTYGIEGTVSNNVGTLKGSASWTTNAGRKCLGFLAGTGNYVDLGGSAELNTNNYTISGWVRTITSGVADRVIIERGSIGAPRGYMMQLYSDNKLYGYHSVGGNFYAVMVNAPFPTDYAFHHVAMTFSYDGITSTLKLYLDGVLKGTSSVMGAPDMPLQADIIKCGKNFIGTIDEIKFFTKALVDEEIAKEYAKGGQW